MASHLFEVDEEELFTDPLGAASLPIAPAPAVPLPMPLIPVKSGKSTKTSNIFDDSDSDDSFDAMIIKAQKKHPSTDLPLTPIIPKEGSVPIAVISASVDMDPLALADPEPEPEPVRPKAPPKDKLSFATFHAFLTAL
jgi:hypothetical protein